MKHKEFQKVVEEYAKEHGFKIFFASWKDGLMYSFGDDMMHNYFQKLMDSDKLARKYLDEKGAKQASEEFIDKIKTGVIKPPSVQMVDDR